MSNKCGYELKRMEHKGDAVLKLALLEMYEDVRAVECWGSNAFLNQIYVPVKIKINPRNPQLKNECLVECYICWRYENWGMSSVKSFLKKHTRPLSRLEIQYLATHRKNFTIKQKLRGLSLIK